MYYGETALGGPEKNRKSTKLNKIVCKEPQLGTLDKSTALDRRFLPQMF